MKEELILMRWKPRKKQKEMITLTNMKKMKKKWKNSQRIILRKLTESMKCLSNTIPTIMTTKRPMSQLLNRPRKKSLQKKNRLKKKKFPKKKKRRKMKLSKMNCD